VSSPLLLLVDDSQAILAFEEAVLGAHYSIVKAAGGHEALGLARELRPAAVLLDLSMPEIDGEQVLAEMKADPDLRAIPVIVVSNEHSRADACLRSGAADFIPKPIRKETLTAVVERVLEQARAAAGVGNLGVLFVETAGVLLALKLSIVRGVALQPETRPLDTGCSFLREAFTFRGAPVAVLDVAEWLGREHRQPLVDRKVVIVRAMPLLALCVDDVREPELVSADRITRGEAGEHTPSPIAEVAVATVRLEAGPSPDASVPLIEPAAAVPFDVRARLPGLLWQGAPIAEQQRGSSSLARSP
jgi:CheY-like chemotaxis protein/chemotaxis signal transduction protein